MSQIRTLRDERRRTFSQNFLVKPSSISRFLDAAELERDDKVVEVGAGSGALTGLLAERCARLVAYEVDRSWSSKLEAEVARRTNVAIVYEDFLAAALPTGPIKVVGNIPFGTTSAIVDRVLGLQAVRSATFITQLEYAKKRTGAYGRWTRLTATTWPEHEWELRGRIPPHRLPASSPGGRWGLAPAPSRLSVGRNLPDAGVRRNGRASVQRRRRIGESVAE